MIDKVSKEQKTKAAHETWKHMNTKTIWKHTIMISDLEGSHMWWKMILFLLQKYD